MYNSVERIPLHRKDHKKKDFGFWLIIFPVEERIVYYNAVEQFFVIIDDTRDNR